MNNQGNEYNQNNNLNSYNMQANINSEMPSPQPAQVTDVYQQPTVNNQEPPKKKKGIVFAIIILIAIVGIGIYLLNGKDSSNTVTNSEEKNKTQVYLNDNKNITDKISLISWGFDSDDYKVFLGFDLKDAAKPFFPLMLYNDKIKSIESGSSVKFYYDNNYYKYSYESVSYDTKNNKATEYIDEHKVVYKEDNIYITETSSDSYYLYYKISENVWTGFRDSENHATWHAFEFGSYSTLDNAKAAIEKYLKNVYICIFTNEETATKCDYKSYRNVNDMVMDMLNEAGIYVNSYDQIRLSDGIKVKNENTSFDISIMTLNNLNTDNYNSFKLNGNDFYINNTKVIHKTKDGSVIEIYVSMPSDLERTEENVIAELKKAFSK